MLRCSAAAPLNGGRSVARGIPPRPDRPAHGRGGRREPRPPPSFPARTALCVGLALLAGCGEADRNEGSAGNEQGSACVQRGEFRLTVSESCEFKPLSFWVVLAKAGEKIDWLAPEGSEVKPGDLVFTQAREQVEEWLKRDTNELEAARKNLTEVQQQVQVELDALQLGVRERECAVTLAAARLAAVTAPAPEAAVAEATAALKAAELAARDRHNAAGDIAELAGKGFVSSVEAQDARNAAALADIDREMAQLHLSRVTDAANAQARAAARFLTERAEVDLALARANEDRRRAELDGRVAEAKSRVAALEQGVAKARAAIVSREVRSPGAGVVIHRFLQSHTKVKAEVGTFAWAGAGVADVADLSRMKIRTQLPERYIRHLKIGDTITVRVTPLPETVHEARVTWIDRWSRDRSSDLAKADRERQGLSGVKVYAVEAALQESTPSVKPGFKGTAEFVLLSLPDALTVPVTAVYGPPHDRFVMVRTDTGSRRVPVRVEAEDDVKAAVTGDLRPGQPLVARSAG